MNVPAVAPLSKSSISVVDRLGTISWNFSRAPADRKTIHAFHSYPARFIPDIPRAIIRELAPAKGSIILDPFCGCGTSLVEAQRAGFDSVGIDLNPIACLISRVKTTPLPASFSSEAEDCVLRASFLRKPEIPDIPNLDHWFQREVSQGLAALRQTIGEVENGVVKQALEAVFSSIIVRVSNQDSDTRYAAVEKTVSKESVFTEFRKGCNQLLKVSKSAVNAQVAGVQVINKSVFDVDASDIKENVGLVVTSPPYPNAYEYWLYHKYRMWWLGYNPLDVKASEIGARAHFFAGPKRKSEEDFLAQMSNVFRLLSQVMKKGAKCCFVVGDSKIHGEIVDNAAILTAAAAVSKFELIFKSDREINPHRKSFNLHHARIKREHILIWQR